MTTFSFDSENPNASIVLPLNNSNLNNGTALNFTVNLTDNIGVKNATLNIYNSTGLFNETTTTFGEGVVSTVIGTVVNLLDGMYNWWWNVFDYGGNSVTTSNNTLTVDTVIPTLSVSSPLNSGYSNGTSILFNVSSSETSSGNGFIVPNLDSSLVSWWRMDDLDGRCLVITIILMMRTKMLGLPLLII